MKIKKIDEEKAEVMLTKEDLQKMELTFEDIDNDELTARLFISGLLKLLDELKIFHVENGNIEVTITKISTEEVVVFFATKKNSQKLTAAYFFGDSESLINFCNNILWNFSKDIGVNLLFKYENFYILLVYLKFSPNKFREIRELQENCITDICTIGKIKEYAKLISRTPLQKIFDLN